MKLEMSLLLVPLTSLHVGGGEAVRASELSIVRDGRGMPFIPASTVRGALRTAAHYAAMSLRERFGLRLVSCGCKEPSEITRAHRRLGVTLCDVCRVWGSPGYESPLKVYDFRVAIGSLAPTIYSTVKVSIDDYSLSKREGALYTIEYVAPGTPFLGKVELDLEDLQCQHVLLLLEAMRLFEAFGPGRQGIARLYIVGLAMASRTIGVEEVAQEIVKLKECSGLLEPLKRLFELLRAPKHFNLYRELVEVNRL